MDLSAVQSRDDVTNLQEAFDLAEKHLNVPKLLEPEGEKHFFHPWSDFQLSDVNKNQTITYQILSQSQTVIRPKPTLIA